MTTEADIHKAIIRAIRAQGGHARKVHQSSVTGGGEPDIDACLRGRSVKVEVKQPGERPTRRQYERLLTWQGAGALAGWATSVEDVQSLLGHVDEPGWVNPQLAAEHVESARVPPRRRSQAAQVGVGVPDVPAGVDPLDW